MDLSQTLKDIQLKDKEEESRVKELLELSAKKYNLQKELESLKTKLTVRENGLKKLRNEVVVLSFEVPVLEKQETVVKKTVEELVRQVVFKDSEVEHIQDGFWGKINNFVADGNRLLTKMDCLMNDKNESGKNPLPGRDNKIRLLKFESVSEAMQLYEEYQSRKIEELKLIKDLLGKDSLEI